MNPFRRSPFVIVAAVLVYFFLYAPIIGLILYSFNASRANVTFEGFIPAFSDTVVMDGSMVKSAPCGPFHWYCDLAKNDDVIRGDFEAGPRSGVAAMQYERPWEVSPPGASSFGWTTVANGCQEWPT